MYYTVLSHRLCTATVENNSMWIYEHVFQCTSRKLSVPLHFVPQKISRPSWIRSVFQCITLSHYWVSVYMFTLIYCIIGCAGVAVGIRLKVNSWICKLKSQTLGRQLLQSKACQDNDASKGATWNLTDRAKFENATAELSLFITNSTGFGQINTNRWPSWHF